MYRHSSSAMDRGKKDQIVSEADVCAPGETHVREHWYIRMNCFIGVAVFFQNICFDSCSISESLTKE